MTYKPKKDPSPGYGMFGPAREHMYGPGESDYITWPLARKRGLSGPMFDLPQGMKPKDAEQLFAPQIQPLLPDPDQPSNNPYQKLMQYAQQLGLFGDV